MNDEEGAKAARQAKHEESSCCLNFWLWEVEGVMPPVIRDVCILLPVEQRRFFFLLRPVLQLLPGVLICMLLRRDSYGRCPSRDFECKRNF